MKPTAIFAANYVQGEDNYTGTEWSYPKLTNYTQSHITELVEEQDLICEYLNWSHPGPHKWIVITHPENRGNIPDLGNTAEWYKLKDIG